MPVARIDMIDRITDAGQRMFIRVVIDPTPPGGEENSIVQRVALEMIEYIATTYADEIEEPDDGEGEDERETDPGDGEE